MKRWLITLCLLCTTPPAALADANLQAFPPAGPGMTRHVLQLPGQADESALQVELVVGKTVATDAHNRYFFGGRIEAQSVPGWGYTRYVVNALGPLAGTLMASDPAVPKVERFISLGGQPFLLRYNSKLPLVVYVPEGAEVRYRIWSAAATFTTLGEG